jgi:hypothetical protein
VLYLHQATRALIKLFVSKMVQRRKATKNSAVDAGDALCVCVVDEPICGVMCTTMTVSHPFADDANNARGGGKSVVERILRQVAGSL